MFLWTLNKKENGKIYRSSNCNSGRIRLQNMGFDLKTNRVAKP